MRICKKENKKDFEPILVDCKRFGYDDYVVVGNKEDNVKLYERVKREGISPSNLPSTSTTMVERLVDHFINDMDTTGSLTNIGDRISDILGIPMLEMEIEDVKEISEVNEVMETEQEEVLIDENIIDNTEVDEEMEHQVGHQVQVAKRDMMAVKMGESEKEIQVSEPKNIPVTEETLISNIAFTKQLEGYTNEIKQTIQESVTQSQNDKETQRCIKEIREYIKESLTQSLDVQQSLAECSTDTSKVISDIFDKIEDINNKLDNLSVTQSTQNTINTQAIQNDKPIDDSKLEERVALFIKILHLLQGDVVVKVLADIITKLSVEENEHVAEFMSVFLQELQKR